MPELALLSRRTFVGLLGGGFAAAGLAACGSSGNDRAGSSAPSAAERSSSAAPPVFPVSVQHKFGTTTVPAAPKRVVAAGYTEQDTLLALGIVPVGVTDWYGEQPDATWPWAHAKLGGAKPTVLHLDDGFQFEKIAALRPDLIVAPNAGMTQADYRKLTAIAPTVAQSGKYTDWFEPWYVQTNLIGTASGQGQATQKIIADIDQSFATARAANPAFAGKKAIFLQNAVYDGSVIAYQNGLSTDFLTKLGFVVPPGLEKFAKEGQAYIPVEQLSVLNSADVLIWATEKDADVANLQKVAGFNRLAAVKAGRSVYTGGVLSAAIYFTSPLSLPYVIERLPPMLAKAFAG